MDTLGRMIAILVLALFLLILPLQYLNQFHVETMDHMVENHTREFVDNIRYQGNITLKDYEAYIYKINQTGELYDIKLEYATPKRFGDLILQTEVDTRQASINPDNLSFFNEIQPMPIGTYKESEADPSKILSRIEVSPSSQSIKKYEKPTFNVYAYYDDETSEILSETDYIITGFDNSKTGEQLITLSYTYHDVTLTCQATVIVTPMTTVCSICGYEYELDENDKDLGCPNCASTMVRIEASPKSVNVNYGCTSPPVTVYAIYGNGKRAVIHNWTSDYDPFAIGFQQVTITYGGLKDYITVEVMTLQRTCSICGNEYSLNQDGSDPGCPICKTTVVSIKAEPDSITIGLHEAFDLEVTATYQDGHTEVVYGWFTDLIPDRTGTFPVTVYYKAVTDQITVTILDDDYIACEYCGESYHRTKYSVCPTCAITIVGIEARLRNGGTKVVKGTALDLDIILIFKDTHREIVNAGYSVSGYQPEQLGEQTVTIQYKDFRCVFTMEVIDGFAKVTCPNGHEYHLNDDGSDSGCPFCSADNDLEQKVVYYDITYTSAILEELYSNNIFEMKAGDYITIIITKKNRSTISFVLDLLGYGKKVNSTLTLGGEIIG